MTPPAHRGIATPIQSAQLVLEALATRSTSSAYGALRRAERLLADAVAAAAPLSEAAALERLVSAADQASVLLLTRPAKGPVSEAREIDDVAATLLGFALSAAPPATRHCSEEGGR